MADYTCISRLLALTMNELSIIIYEKPSNIYALETLKHNKKIFLILHVLGK